MRKLKVNRVFALTSNDTSERDEREEKEEEKRHKIIANDCPLNGKKSFSEMKRKRKMLLFLFSFNVRRQRQMRSEAFMLICRTINRNEENAQNATRERANEREKRSRKCDGDYSIMEIFYWSRNTWTWTKLLTENSSTERTTRDKNKSKRKKRQEEIRI